MNARVANLRRERLGFVELTTSSKVETQNWIRSSTKHLLPMISNVNSYIIFLQGARMYPTTVYDKNCQHSKL